MNFKIEFENGGCEKRKRCPRVGFPGNRPRVRDGGEVRIFCLLGHHAFTHGLPNQKRASLNPLIVSKGVDSFKGC